MNNKKEWLKAEIEELIVMYQGKPELWDVTTAKYKNRIKKQDALKKMAEVFSTTTEEIQRKIHNLRNQFNSELKKHKEIKSGQSTDELYIPKWPYYKLLSFLQEGSACRQSFGNLPKDTAKEKTANENRSLSDNHGATLEQYSEENRSDATPVSNKNELNPKKKRKIEVSGNDVLIQKAIRALDEEDDQFDIFGKYVASEMRSLSSEYLRKKMKRQFQEVILRINQEDELLSNPESSFNSNTN